MMRKYQLAKPAVADQRLDVGVNERAAAAVSSRA